MWYFHFLLSAKIDSIMICFIESSIFISNHAAGTGAAGGAAGGGATSGTALSATF